VTGIVNLEKWENNQGRIRRRRKEKEKYEMRISMGGLNFSKTWYRSIPKLRV
jgi:hypothetical protein